MSFPQVPSPLCVFPSSLFVSLSISVSRSCVPNWDGRSRRGRRKRSFLGPPRLRAGRRGDTWTEASVSRVGGEFTGFAILLIFCTQCTHNIPKYRDLAVCHPSQIMFRSDVQMHLSSEEDFPHFKGTLAYREGQKGFADLLICHLDLG